MPNKSTYEAWLSASNTLDKLYDAKEKGEDVSEEDFTKAVTNVVLTSRAKRKSEGRRYQ